MLVQPLPAPDPRPSAMARFMPLRSASSRGCSASTGWSPAAGTAAQTGHADRFFPDAYCFGGACSSFPPMDFFPAKTSARSLPLPKAPRASRFSRWWSTSSSWRRSSPKIPTSIRSCPPSPATMPADSSSVLKPPFRAPPQCRRDHSGITAETGRLCRHPDLSAEPSAHPDRGHSDQEPISIHPSEPGH